MTDKSDELEIISISELPIPMRSVNWPYDEWEKKLNPGEATEITNKLKGRKASSVSSTIMMATRRRGLRIKSLVRNNRIWIYKPLEEDEPSD